jgi:hypothetical protein
MLTGWEGLEHSDPRISRNSSSKSESGSKAPYHREQLAAIAKLGRVGPKNIGNFKRGIIADPLVLSPKQKAPQPTLAKLWLDESKKHAKRFHRRV